MSPHDRPTSPDGDDTPPSRSSDEDLMETVTREIEDFEGQRAHGKGIERTLEQLGTGKCAGTCLLLVQALTLFLHPTTALLRCKWIRRGLCLHSPHIAQNIVTITLGHRTSHIALTLSLCSHSCTSLDFTGAYQWRLFALCGCGWMSDNSALCCIAVILPRVKVHFGLKDEVVGLLSASTMGGMMIGAVGWGVISDLVGRALPFHTTLLMTALFGIGASFSGSFGGLCWWLFFMGTAVG